MRLLIFLFPLLLLGSISAAHAQDVPSVDDALGAPLPEADGSLLEPAVLKYTAKIESGEQEIDLDVQRTIEQADLDGATVWRIVEAMILPMNAAADTFEVDEQTLQPLRRSAGGAGTNIVLDYSNSEIRGSIRATGHEENIHHPLESEVFADGAGLELAISTLPLTSGYETIVRTFDPQAGESRPMQLTVTGETSITTEFGTFDTHVVELIPLDDSGAGAATLHLQQEKPHYLIKGEYELPSQMGGGVMTLELVYRE